MFVQKMLIATVACTLFVPAIFAKDKGIPEDYKLVYEQDFEKPESLNDFIFANPDNWKIAKKDGNSFLDFSGGSKYKPPVRSPKNIALLTHRRVGDFVLEADMLQTGKSYGHRDMCLFYNFQSPDRYYYTHIASVTDPHAHNCFIVNGEPRKKISHKTTDGADWGQEKWQKVRIVRNCGEGTIKVYFNDMKTPIMEATDKTFKEGWLGFGSFDDTGRIDNVKLWAPGELKAWRPKFFTSKPVKPMEPQPKVDGPEFKSIYDGKTLDGWKMLNGTAKFIVEDGDIVGICDPKGRRNSYLSTEKKYDNFILTLETKLEKPGNSGIQLRSREREKDGLVTGYQIEIDPSERQWSGGFYEERGRGWMVPLNGDMYAKARKAFKLDGWNQMVIKADGNHFQTWVNGVPIADYYDNDKELSASTGFIGLQVHWPVKPEWRGRHRWRNIKIKELPKK